MIAILEVGLEKVDGGPPSPTEVMIMGEGGSIEEWLSWSMRRDLSGAKIQCSDCTPWGKLNGWLGWPMGPFGSEGGVVGLKKNNSGPPFREG